MTEVAELRENDLLLIVDLQNDFCHGGTMPVEHGDAIVPLVNRLAERFRHVVATQDWHPRKHQSFASTHPGKSPYDVIQVSYGDQILWPDHCVSGTKGAEFHPELEIERAKLVLRKGFHQDIDSYSAFYENDRKTPTGMTGFLRDRGITRLFLVGMTTDFSILYSAVDAAREGFDVHVIEDAVRGINLKGSLEEAWMQMAEGGVRRVLEKDLVTW